MFTPIDDFDRKSLTSLTTTSLMRAKIRAYGGQFISKIIEQCSLLLMYLNFFQ